MLSWHVGIWRSYFNSHRKNFNAIPLPQPAATAYVRPVECVHSGQPVRLRPVMIKIRILMMIYVIMDTSSERKKAYSHQILA